MILKAAPPAYDQADQAALRDALRRADEQSLKRNRDIEPGGGRIILASPDGTRWALGVSDAGATTWTPL